MTAAADRHLLFGLLALQNGIINQGQLVAAFQAWTFDKSRGLADHLEARGDLTGTKRALLEALAGVHLETHEGDIEESLASISTGRTTRERLASLGDSQIEALLARVQATAYSRGSGDAELTASYSLGSATSDGQRFRVLRPHAQGGLGAVFVALDVELNREVALKQILDAHADDLASRQRFMIEAEITGGLEHPGVVPVYGLGTYGDGRPYYAMRFIKGDSLKQAIDRYHKDRALAAGLGRGSLELHNLLRRFTDVCNAIELGSKNGELDAQNLELDRQLRRAERRETLAIDAVSKFRNAVESNPELKNRRELDALRKALLREPLTFFGKLRDELQADRDTQPGALARLADANYELARTTEEIGSAPDAIRSYSESIALHERLSRDAPTAVSCQYHLAASHNHLGVLLRATGRPADAMESYRRAAAAFERMSRDEPSVVQYEDDLAGCYLNMGNLLRATGQPTAAIESYRKGLVVFERLEHQHPTNTQVRVDLAVSHMNIGNVLSDMGRRDDALSSYRRALPIHERLAAENPHVHEYESGLAADLDNIGSLLASMGRHTEAMESHRRALGLFERLASSHPAVTRFQNELAICYMNIGNLFDLIGQPAQAQDSFGRGLEIQERLVRDHPSVPGYRNGLGGLLNNVAMFQMSQRRWEEARVLLDRAVEQQRAAIKSLPRHPVYRRFLRNHLSNLATVHRALKQPGEAARIGREWADLVRGDPADLYNVACSLALVVPLAHGEQRQALAAEALRVLKEAVAAGWKDAPRTTRDPSLAALHDLDDFERLLAQMFDRVFPADPFVR